MELSRIPKPSELQKNSPIRERKRRGSICMSGGIFEFKVEEEESKTKAIEDLLKNPMGTESFLDYLKGEFSEENLLFWIDVQQLSQCDDSATIKQMTNKIYTTYVKSGAKCAVNLPASIQKELTISFEKGTLHSSSFDKAAESTLVTMQEDSYSRYLKSDQYSMYSLIASKFM